MARSPRVSAATPEQARPIRGRPRSTGADTAILEATVALLVESGLDGTTTQAIADRAGVARATVYLRWPTREAVITAALHYAIGRDPFPLSGDIEEDMRRAGRQGQSIFSQPLFRAVVPVLVREFLRLDAAGVTFDTLFPNRVRFGQEYDRLAARQGFRTDVEGELVVDMVIGAMLLHFLATTSAPSARYCDRLVDLMLSSLRLDRPTTTI
jgi:AcrR family transcriptional regulator